MKQLLTVSLLLIVCFSLTQCSKDSLGDMPVVPVEEPEPEDEEKFVFSKDANADPTLEVNQDRITDNVWITRGNEGGQIYNAKTETAADKMSSPAGTRWAVGIAENKDNLTFAPFREAVSKPKSVVGKNLVMHLVEDNIYINIKFSAWDSDKGGSFAYERTKL